MLTPITMANSPKLPHSFSFRSLVIELYRMKRSTGYRRMVRPYRYQVLRIFMR